VRLPVLVEIDVGAGRCGVQPGPDAVALAQCIARSRHLIFGGLQAYHGSAQHRRTPAERRTLIDGAIDASRRTVEQLRQQAIDCPIVGGGGTGTFALEAASGIYNEIQAGSYVFMDADYARNLDDAGQPISTFRHALFVLSTVMSVPRPAIAVLDAGLKALAVDSGLPQVWQRPDIRYVSASDEHGKLEVASETTMPVLGEKLRLVPGHCDPTVDRYDWYVGVRGRRVECLWPVAAKGGMA
jgi:3-hydroxy-D-aspartate aldolase